MGLIDTHTHLESFARKGVLDATLARAKEAGVEAMVTIGTAPDDWSLYRDLAAAHAGYVQYTVGVHPCSVEAGWESAVAQIEEFWPRTDATRASRPQDGRAGGQSGGPEASGSQPAAVSPERLQSGHAPVALGECGLDRFHLPKEPAKADEIFAWQCAAFDAQLAIAKRVGCPVVVHSRGAFHECLERIDRSGVDWSRVVFHCFTENEAEILELTQRGGVGSFTGILTYKSAENVRIAARAQGLGRFMVETDAPYLTPMPHRGKPNEPAFLRHTAEFAASDVFGVPFDELAAISTANAKRFYGLGGKS